MKIVVISESSDKSIKMGQSRKASDIQVEEFGPFECDVFLMF